MAWIKIPAEHHPIFRANLPRGATTKNMFGGIAAFVNDKLFGGLFARSIIVKLSEPHHREALALDGAGLFDPTGTGRVMKDTVLMPESVMDEPAALKHWLQRAYDHVKSLPAKAKPKAASKAKPKPNTKATKTKSANKLPKKLRVAKPTTRAKARKR